MILKAVTLVKSVLFTLRPSNIVSNYIINIFQAKEMIGVLVFHEDPQKTPSLNTQLGAALIAGFTASFVSLPFDLLKSRMRKFLHRFFILFAPLLMFPFHTSQPYLICHSYCIAVILLESFILFKSVQVYSLIYLFIRRFYS
jgi:hypothetical protein